jgi:hypothetical protein
MIVILKKIGRWILYIIGGLALAFVGLMIYRIPHVNEVDRAKIVIPQILASHITLADVLGTHLPPAPDQTVNDSTLAGIDANRNGIRDDVELAIFKLHPESQKIRAAELQYAMAYQLYMTEVFNSDTLVAAMIQYDRSFACISHINPTLPENHTQADETKQFITERLKRTEVERVTLNTQIRKNFYEKLFHDYAKSDGNYSTPDCDIDLKSLPD